MIKNSYTNTMYTIYEFKEDGIHFSVTKYPYSEVLKLVEEQAVETFSLTRLKGEIQITSKVGLSISSLYDNIIYETEVDDSFSVIKGYTDNKTVYYKFTEEKNKDVVEKFITLKLGKREKKLKLIEYSEYISKPVKDTLLCTCQKDLQKYILEEKSERDVNIFRRILGIKVFI